MAKMLMLAVSALAALSGASARTLSQAQGAAFADAVQLSKSFSDENLAEGITDAETSGADDTSLADAEGFAGYQLSPRGGNNFADSETNAVTRATTLNQASTRPDAQSFALSGAESDGAAQATANSEAVAVYAVGAGSGQAGSVARAIADDFAGATTSAQAYGTDTAVARADSEAIAFQYAESESDASAIAVGGNAGALAYALSDSLSDPADPGAFAQASSDASSLSQLGSANSLASSAAFNDEIAQADATSTASITDPIPGLPIATRTRATSRAGGTEFAPTPGPLVIIGR